jgi:hypothetical protein
MSPPPELKRPDVLLALKLNGKEPIKHFLAGG